ncbi:MAG: cytochrome c oxidase accessory protein CcoG [Raineya sp.]|jgi:cytochrome c oxidase accessory protein FixG|nr:cytochrome c oxidase accessory protein CcoG [Raineya sp.]
MVTQESPKEGFREQLGVLDKKGGRQWMYPKQVNGFFYKARTVFGIFLLVILFGMPLIKVNGHPFMLFNILERKFIVFGIPFFPQDFFILALSLISFIVFIALFTVVFGRLFCGWACPQTVFMEMVFRRIEYWIEGDANAQKKLNESPWTTEKVIKKTAKHTIFFSISFLIAHTFLSYLIGVDEVKKVITEGIVENWKTFLVLILFTGAFYAVFAFMREIVCIVACPYGRMQSVLLDSNSIVVAYDTVRGEPRGKIKKGDETPKGDCVDCKLCVQVCPTGIDIRNGTQLECINCTACIDVCDDVMVKIGKPKKLIRYDSVNGIKSGKKLKLSARIIGYSTVLVLLLVIIGIALFTRTDVQANVMRTPGMMYQQIDANTVANLYNISLVNKSFDSKEITLKLEDGQVGKIKLLGNQNSIKLKPQEITKATFFIEIPNKSISESHMKLKIKVFKNGEFFTDIKTTFLAPAE